MTKFKRSAVLALAMLALIPGAARASHPTVNLGGTVETFAVLGAETVTNTGGPATVVNGNLGVSPGTDVTGGPTVVGAIHTGPTSLAAAAQLELGTAYTDAANRACPTTGNLTGTDLGGLTLTAGVYCFSSSAGLTGTLTLDAQNDPNAVFIFQIGSGLTTASSSTVLLTNGAQACNVFWQVGESAVFGTTTTFRGTVMALTTITANTGTQVIGRLLADNGAVNLNSNIITRPTTCSHPQAASTPAPTATPTAGPTGDTTGTTGGTTPPPGRGRTTGGGAPGTGGEIPDTGPGEQTEPALATGLALLLVGLLCNHLGSSSSRLALAFRGYRPRRRAPRRGPNSRFPG